MKEKKRKQQGLRKRLPGKAQKLFGWGEMHVGGEDTAGTTQPEGPC